MSNKFALSVAHTWPIFVLDGQSLHSLKLSFESGVFCYQSFGYVKNTKFPPQIRLSGNRKCLEVSSKKITVMVKIQVYEKNLMR
jgi:hypothetical protein